MAENGKFVKKNALLFYFALSLIITWGGILLLIGFDGILGRVDISDTQMPLLYAVTLLGPSIAGLISIAVFDAREGFRSLASRLRKGKVSFYWYLVALLTAPLLILTLLLIFSQFSDVFTPALFSETNKSTLLLTGIFMGLVVGLFEELGWTGFALPKLRQKFSVFTSGIILGLFWGLWHLPLFVASTKSSGAVPPVLYLLILLFSFLPVYRVLMVWVYDHTESLLLMVLMHAPLSASQLLLIPPDISGVQLIIFDLTFAVVLWVIVVLITIFSKRGLSTNKKGI
jgi:membrane protease YdiL (CAAX protease family)